MTDLIAIVAILITLGLAFSQWLAGIRRKAFEGERAAAITDLREEFRKELEKEINEVKLELASLRSLKSKVDLIELRMADIFTLISKMSDNLDKYVEKIDIKLDKKVDKP